MTRRENHALVYFVFAASIYSYGFQFELETGQYYTIAMMLSLAAIYIFHYHPRHRFFAYVLFCVSVQLKVFPAIFALMFVDHWQEWKVNLKRFAVLGIVNFLLLFLLGYAYFNSFIQRLINEAATLELEYNHSIYAFIANLSASGYGIFSGDSLKWISENSALLKRILFLYFFACLLIVLWKAYLQNKSGVDTNLLMVCLLGGMVIPAISHSYKLSMLGAPFVLMMSDHRMPPGLWKRAVSIALIVCASLAYSATLVPFNARPVYLENALPLLFILLTIATVLKVMQKDTFVESDEKLDGHI